MGADGRLGRTLSTQIHVASAHMAKLITQHVPQRWEELEEAVTNILVDAGMNAKRQVRLDFPRGGAVVDVLASEVHDGEGSHFRFTSHVTS